MTTQRLSPDDVRALFSDHVEGSLDAATRQAVDDALAADPALAAEHRRFAATLGALRALPRPTPPADLAARVRARLDADRATATAASSSSAGSSSAAALASTALLPANDVLPLHRALNDEVLQARPRKRFGVEFFAAVGSIAAVLALVVVGVPVFNGRAYVRGDGDGVVTAGLASAGVVDVTWRAPGLPTATLLAAAREAGVTVDASGRFVGDRDTVARFLVALKAAGAAHGVDVTATVPEHSGRVAVVVRQ
jgi:anti-sigma factor RsiW